MFPRLLLPVTALALLCACGPSDSGRDSTSTASGSPTGGPTTTGTPTTTPTPPPVFTALGSPTAIDPDGGDQHHATIALSSTGIPWLTYVRDGAVRTRVHDGSPALDDSAPVPFNHPQIGASAGAFVGLATLTSGGLNAQSWTEDGLQLGTPTWLDATIGGFPDVALLDGSAVAAWSEGGSLGLAHFDVGLVDPQTLPPADPLVAGRTISTLAVDLSEHGGWLAWSEATTGSPATVVLAPLDPSSGAGDPLELAIAIDGSWDARPDVAATEAGALVAWRGATGPTLPRQAWIAAAQPGGPSPRALGSAGANRPDLAHAEGVAAAVWDQPDGVWLELIDPADGSSLLGPIELTESDDLAERPAVALRYREGGWDLAACWEATAVDQREVRVLEARITPAALRRRE